MRANVMKRLMICGAMLVGWAGMKAQDRVKLDQQPVPLYQAQPGYPYHARILGLEGEVVIEFIVMSTGEVTQAKPVRYTHPIFIEPALFAVNRWRFKPGRHNGRLVNSRMQVPIYFQLHGDSTDDAPLPDNSPLRPVYKVAPQVSRDDAAGMKGGEVVLNFKVQTNGQAAEARVVSSTDPRLEAPALAAIAQWLFMPARKDGQWLEQRATIPIVFDAKDAVTAATAPAAPAGKPTVIMPTGAVYPFAELVANERATVTGTVRFDALGRVEAVEWLGDVPEAYRRSIEAMLDAMETWSDAAAGTYEWRWDFHPYDGDVRINDTAAAILKRLRVEGEKADFAGETDLDAPLQMVLRREPVFPTRVTPELNSGEAVVEFFVDESGQAQLPRIVSASEPAFGHAACQAVADWRYVIPRRNSKPTVVRMQVALSFGRD